MHTGCTSLSLHPGKHTEFIITWALHQATSMLMSRVHVQLIFGWKLTCIVTVWFLHIQFYTSSLGCLPLLFAGKTVNRLVQTETSCESFAPSLSAKLPWGQRILSLRNCLSQKNINPKLQQMFSATKVDVVQRKRLFRYFPSNFHLWNRQVIEFSLQIQLSQETCKTNPLPQVCCRSTPK